MLEAASHPGAKSGLSVLESEKPGTGIIFVNENDYDILFLSQDGNHPQPYGANMTTKHGKPHAGRRASFLLGGLLAAATAAHAEAPPAEIDPEVIIVGGYQEAYETAGAAHFVGPEELLKFNYSDIQDIVREVPGVSVQLEDGYGLRPNLSIRGTPTERSGRITLMEDGVLIAPAPYSAPSAYYFPTAGRMHAFEVLKGPAAVTQGPYTIGGALNMISTPVPRDMGGGLLLEGGGHSTHRLHAHAGFTSDEGVGLMFETHDWASDGFQKIDRLGGDTGLDIQDHTFKLRYAPPGSRHRLDFKYQYADQDSDQSYLGLTDADFQDDPHRRYGLSRLDNIKTQHDQHILRYRFEASDALTLSATAYNNDHERNWFKTEGLDIDGTDDGDRFTRQSWYKVIQTINAGKALQSRTVTQSFSDGRENVVTSGITNAYETCAPTIAPTMETRDDNVTTTTTTTFDDCYSADDLQGILDGTVDTAAGGIQLKTNAREYFSRGIQARLDWEGALGGAEHNLEIGIRYHEDEEDRVQRIDAYSQIDGRLVLHDEGTLGHRAAGNRIQEAEAVSVYVHDRIEWDRWVFTPGFRYEDIDQMRTRYTPGPNGERVYRDSRKNDTEVFLPGLGVLFQVDRHWSVLAGYHRGFSAPSNSPGVEEEKADNYEFGVRYADTYFRGEVVGFYSDYENLLGECTASSGTGCTIGDAFNGDAATVEGVEAMFTADVPLDETLAVPLSASYTYIDAEFDTGFESEFFGDVEKGDPLPYIPEHQFRVSAGLEGPDWSINLSGRYTDEVCVRASCGNFEKTDSSFITDLSGSYRLNENISLIARVENLGDQEDIVGRHPYGARPNKPRTGMIGLRVDNFF